MTRAILTLSLLLAACASASEEAEEVAAPPAPYTAPATTVDPVLATDANAALDLWSRATAGQARFEGLTITLGQIAECLDRAGTAGCYRPSTHQIDVSPLVRSPARASTIAHELGHALGLPDMPGTGLLMDPDRDDRDAQCIDTETAAAAGLGGPGACL